MAFTKLFGELLSSSVWQEPAETRLVWVTMLAMADQNGEVMASVPGLAKLAGVSIEECEAAIVCFLSPDRYSRTKDFDGRRIVEIDGGWELLNHSKYRKKKSKEELREQRNARQKRWRDRKAGQNVDACRQNVDIANIAAPSGAKPKATQNPPSGTPSNGHNVDANVDACRCGVDAFRSEAEAEAEYKSNAAKSPRADYPEWFEQFWKAYPANKAGRKRGKAKTLTLAKKIPATERDDLTTAAGNYAKEAGEFVRDPERFVKDDFWRDYLESPVSARPNRVADLSDPDFVYDPAGGSE